MKSSYELAMERLNKTAPVGKVSEEMKKELAELDAKYAAKVAEREIFLKGEVSKAIATRDYESLQQLEKQMNSEKKKLHEELEEKKEAIRKRKA